MATTTKNTTSNPVKGSASSKDFPKECSSIIPVKAVWKIINASQINPTGAICNARPIINKIAAIDWMRNAYFSFFVRF